ALTLTPLAGAPARGRVAARWRARVTARDRASTAIHEGALELTQRRERCVLTVDLPPPRVSTTRTTRARAYLIASFKAALGVTLLALVAWYLWPLVGEPVSIPLALALLEPSELALHGLLLLGVAYGALRNAEARTVSVTTRIRALERLHRVVDAVRTRERATELRLDETDLATRALAERERLDDPRPLRDRADFTARFLRENAELSR
ncbi:MAG: hypothetical protein KC468_31760, partial [Myxococcales bacterium]|nr:hypothetical protein [Myxococcales bacterium]